MPDLTITVAGTGSGSRPDEVATVGNLPAATGARPGTTLRTIRTHREAARVFAAQPSPRVIGGALLVALARRALDRRTGNGSGPSVPGEAAAVAVVLATRGLHEYAIHRWLLHAPRRVIRGWAIDPGAGHRAHHADPDVIDNALIPPVRAAAFAVMIAAYVDGTCRLLGVTARTRHSATTAAVAALLDYEWQHYLDHTSVPLRASRARALRTHHRAHHFVDERRDLGITSRTGDRLAALVSAARR